MLSGVGSPIQPDRAQEAAEMRVGDICNREVVVIDEERSIKEAAMVMREYHVGDTTIDPFRVTL